MAIPTKKLKTIQLAAIIFLTVSGGPYGLEPLLTYAGSNASILLLLLTPLLWDIPSIITVLELNSMMPVTGGYYQWVKRGLGLRWAFYEGWWTWIYTFVDLAIYPVLFVEYASFFFPQIEAYKIPVCLIMIWSSAALNIRGIVPVGKTSIFLGIVVLVPFVVLFVVALIKYSGQISIPAQTLKGHSFSSTGLALYTIMWNFIGWDNTTTYAEEVDKPARSYLASIITAFFIVLMIYMIAVLIAIQSGISAEVLNDNGFPALGTLVGGHWLGAMIAVGGMASALGLYSAVLLSVSRVPQVMAKDKLLPKKLTLLHPKFNSPYVSILACSVAVSFMILWTFGELLIIDVTVYGAALFLEYITLIRLRIIAPGEKRPFKIPLNVVGLSLMILLPLAVYAIALTAAFTSEGSTITPVLFAVATLLTAEVVWRFITARNKKLLE
ncbi:MAG: family permease [Segetibacter sp.]|nr:family permease [Segetibacter sp.]